MNYKLTYSDVYALCNRNQWFTSGSLNQYRKLFEIVENGATIDEIALVIWLCSSDVTREEVKQAVEKCLYIEEFPN